MRNFTISICLLAAACGTDTSVNATLERENVQAYVQEMCGAIPLAPGYEYAIDNVNGGQYAVFSVQDAQNIDAWRDAQDKFDNCLFSLNGK